MTNHKNFVTSDGRVSYPAVFTPKKNKFNDKVEYEITLMFPKTSPHVQELKAIVVAAAKEKFGEKIPANFKNPLKDGDQAVESDGVTPKKGYAGMVYAKFSVDSAKTKPAVIDENMQPILEQSKFYGGCFARVNASAYGYDKAGNRGVSFNLFAVQKVRDGEPFGTATPDVASVFTPVVDQSGADNAANYKKSSSNDLLGF